MNDNRRHHPALVLFKVGKLIRNSIFIILILFVLQADNDGPLFVYGRYAFLLFFLWSIVSAILNWLTATYALDDQRFYLRRGIFSKTDQSIPFSKVQNINRHTSFFHRVIGLTSIRFETGIAGEDATVNFEVATKKKRRAWNPQYRNTRSRLTRNRTQRISPKTAQKLNTCRPRGNCRNSASPISSRHGAIC